MDVFVLSWSLFYKAVLLVGMAIAIIFSIRDLDAKYIEANDLKPPEIMAKWTMLVLLVPGWVATVILTIIQLKKLG